MSDKIKMRRGELPDLPDLDAGEFGLATDVNSVYIGNPDGNGNILVNPVKEYMDGYSIDGYLVPAVDNSHGLGSPSLRWNNIVVGPDSIHIRSLPGEISAGERNWNIGIDDAGRLSFNSDGYVAYSIAPTGTDANDQEILYWDNATSTIKGSTKLIRTTSGLNIPATTTEQCAVQIGEGRSGNGYSYIDLVGDATYTDYGLRVIRNNAGANTDSSLLHRGTGALLINARDAGSIELYTNNTKRMTLNSSGDLLVDATITNTSGDLTISPSGDLVVDATGGSIVLPASTTETRSVQIGDGRSGNGYAYIDLVGDATYTDYGLRFIRNNAGANTNSGIIHRGTGILYLMTQDAGSIELYTNNTKRMTLDSSGNLALGSSSPYYFLDVRGDDADWIANFINDGNNTNRYGIRIRCGADDMSSGTNYFMGFYDGDGGIEGYIRCVNGTVELAQASDINRKTDIVDTKVDALNIVNNLEVKEFRFRKDGYAEPGSLHPADFIAQNVQKYIPEAVGGEDGTLMLSQTALIPYLTKAIQQLDEKVDLLTEEVNLLKTQVNK